MNLRIYTGVDETRTEIITHFTVSEKTTQTNVETIHLLLGAVMPGSSFEKFCQDLNLTPEQIDNLRHLNYNTHQDYLKRQTELKGWEG